MGCGMSISANEARATKVEFGADSFSVTLLDGRILSVPKAWFPTLCDASAAQLDNYVLSGGGIGIHWDELDEDIFVPGLLLGTPSVKFTA